MGPTQTLGGTPQMGKGTRGKRGITQEEVSLGIERGIDYKREKSPLILIIPVMGICDSRFNLEHISCLASLQHCLVH